jgi:hypothetical protein
MGSAIVTVLTTGSDLIDSVTSVELDQYESLKVVDIGGLLGETTYAAVAWTSLVGVTSGSVGYVIKTGTQGWNADAISVASLPSNNGGCVWSVGQITANIMLGLSIGKGSLVYNIDYGIYTKSDGTINIYQGTVSISYATPLLSYTTGTILKVDKSGTTITYWAGASLLYTSLVAATGSAYFSVVAIYSTAAVVSWTSIYNTPSVGKWAIL